MNTVVAICLLALVAMVSAKGGAYTDRFDNVNVDEILENRRLLIPYMKCVLDQGKCSPEGKELKSHIREALEQNCAKCTESQKRNSRKVLTHLINNESDYWNQLVAKYDPQRKFTQKYEKDLRAMQG